MVPNGTAYASFPEFANNGNKTPPGGSTDSAKYAQGMLPADTFPAEWANYLFHGATAGITRLNTDTLSIKEEINTVLSSRDENPDATKTNQLLTVLNKIKAEAILAAHPVGSLYWTSSTENPAVTFGGGTWKQIKDKFILAAGDTYTNGDTGGSATVQLTESQLPAHKHSFTPSGTISGGSYTFSGTSKNVDSGGAWSGYIRAFSGGKKPLSGMNEHDSGYYPEGTSDNMGRDLSSGSSNNTWWSFGKSGHTHSYTPEGSVSVSSNPSFSGTDSDTDSKGDGNSFSIMPPYITKYCWERVS